MKFALIFLIAYEFFHFFEISAVTFIITRLSAAQTTLLSTGSSGQKGDHFNFSIRYDTLTGEILIDIFSEIM